MLSRLSGGGIARAFRHSEYRRFASGDVVSLLGTWVQRVAIGWLTWELTKSGTWLGIVSFAELAPSILFSPLGGAYADRADRLKIAIGTEAMQMLQALAFTVLTFAGWIEIWTVVALTAVRGCLNAWSHPARQAVISSLVPRAELATAVAMNSVLFNSARFIGPAIAGVVIVEWGTGYAFLINTLSFVAFIIALIGLRPPYPDTVVTKQQPLIAQLTESYAYIIRHPGIGPVMLLLLVTSLFARPVADLLPGYAGAVFRNGASGLAWMTSSMGIGAMIGGFMIAQRGHVNGLTRVAIINTCLMGGALIAFALAPAFWIALVALAATSFAISTMSIACQSLVQTAVDGNLRGRVVSVYGMIFRAGPAVGALVMGALAENLGWTWPVVAGALLCLAIWLWGKKKSRTIKAALEDSVTVPAAAG